MENASYRTDRIDLAFDTARLRARGLREVDEELFCTLFCDPEVMRFIGTPLTPECAARKFTAAIEDHDRDSVVLTVSERRTGNPIGICSIHKINRVRRGAEAGMVLLTEHQARGYTKEAFPALVTHAFARLPIDELRVRIADAHTIGLHTSASFGFTRRVDLETAEGGPGLQVWSVDRNAWLNMTAIAQRGETDVGTHRLP